jgi:hypothetical protein
VGSQVDELGSAIQVGKVFNVKLEVDGLVVFVGSVYLHFVDDTIAHLWQETGLVL